MVTGPPLQAPPKKYVHKAHQIEKWLYSFWMYITIYLSPPRFFFFVTLRIISDAHRLQGWGIQRHTLLTLAWSSGLEISAHDSDVWVNWCDCWLARQHRGKMTGTWILAGHQCLISSPKSLEMHVIWKKSTMLWTVLNTRSRQRPFSINPS